VVIKRLDGNYRAGEERPIRKAQSLDIVGEQGHGSGLAKPKPSAEPFIFNRITRFDRLQ
jgi:hypothetical protein